jgi:UDP-N-acetylmuramyl-tripeptide synthetase
MKLNKMLPLSSEKITGSTDIEISGISYDSRNIKKGDIFFALPGHNTDGLKFAEEAVSKGACAVVCEAEGSNLNVTQITVKDILKFMSEFCAKFYGHPDREMTVIGITGTNGKTTITYIIESILADSGIQCGVIGTVNYRYAGKVFDAPNTTPQSADVYRMMREMADCGIKYAVMEVSSHALSLGRVAGIDFDIAIFTNLTRDHLDFHKDIEKYFEAKSMLFVDLGKGTKTNTKYAIINTNDKFGKKLSKININAENKSYGAKSGGSADFQAENIEIKSSGSSFNIVHGTESEKIEINHIGLHNVYNALAALASCVCCGISFRKASEGLSRSAQAPGRLERVDTKNSGFEIVVDYAHTDDALVNVLSALKKIKPVRIITVFGCGGDRDRTKRPIMGKTAVEMSDFVFVTSDNPRTENANNIILDVEVGIKRAGKKNYKVIADREKAIKEAVMMAEKGDIVLLAGKGHETYQIIGTEKIHFNDIEIAEKYLKEKEKQKFSSKRIEQKEFVF